MYPGTFARTTPDKPAIIRPATGTQVTYRELDERSTRLAHHLRDLGMRPGDTVAMVSANDLRCFELYWAAVRSGLYITAVNHHLTASEVNYILDDCDASVVFADAGCAPALAALDEVDGVHTRIAWGGEIPGFADYEDVLSASSSEPLTDQPRGQDFLYSSGTTGRPKGIKVPRPDGQVDEVLDPYTTAFAPMYGFGPDTVYLSPAPLYHAAPLRFCGTTNSTGGTVVIMDRFDPEQALSYIERFGVTHSQWVPTMFIRMLKLPKEIRESYDVSSMRVAIHAAAPCPAEVKAQMMQWWGPVIHEYYASTEAPGSTFIGPTEALAHPGSVGRPLVGEVHICDDTGRELPAGEIGTIYFARDKRMFAYHKDDAKTESAYHPENPLWATTGDIGYLDDEGFLYLTDRKAFMIISGGVNIYPQEAENVLIGHPAVYDVGVIGVPDPEMGESVKACVQLADGYSPSDELADELITYVRSQIAAYKAPRSVDFLERLPRTPTGKLVKGDLRKIYAARG